MYAYEALHLNSSFGYFSIYDNTNYLYSPIRPAHLYMPIRGILHGSGLLYIDVLEKTHRYRPPAGSAAFLDSASPPLRRREHELFSLLLSLRPLRLHPSLCPGLRSNPPWDNARLGAARRGRLCFMGPRASHDRISAFPCHHHDRGHRHYS